MIYAKYMKLSSKVRWHEGNVFISINILFRSKLVPGSCTG